MSGLVVGVREEGGFSLLELIIALLLFEIGLLAVAGMILVAQITLKRSALILRGTVEAVRAGDSLLEAGVGGEGEMELGWGWIRWAPPSSAEGGLQVWALAPDRIDTLAALRVWPPPGFQPLLEGIETAPSDSATPEEWEGDP